VTTVTDAPFRAAVSAAAHPAIPEPITRTSVWFEKLMFRNIL
jgi:hypothetical protein